VDQSNSTGWLQRLETSSNFALGITFLITVCLVVRAYPYRDKVSYENQLIEQRDRNVEQQERLQDAKRTHDSASEKTDGLTQDVSHLTNQLEQRRSELDTLKRRLAERETQSKRDYAGYRKRVIERLLRSTQCRTIRRDLDLDSRQSLLDPLAWDRCFRDLRLTAEMVSGLSTEDLRRLLVEIDRQRDQGRKSFEALVAKLQSSLDDAHRRFDEVGVGRFAGHISDQITDIQFGSSGQFNDLLQASISEIRKSMIP
jgi:hypothetical protein